MVFPACGIGKNRFQRGSAGRVDLGGKNVEFVDHAGKESVFKVSEP